MRRRHRYLDNIHAGLFIRYNSPAPKTMFATFKVTWIFTVSIILCLYLVIGWWGICANRQLDSSPNEVASEHTCTKDEELSLSSSLLALKVQNSQVLEWVEWNISHLCFNVTTSPHLSVLHFCHKDTPAFSVLQLRSSPFNFYLAAGGTMKLLFFTVVLFKQRDCRVISKTHSHVSWGWMCN